MSPKADRKGQGEKQHRDLVGLQDKLNTQGEDQVSIPGGEIRSRQISLFMSVFSIISP